MKFTQSLPLYIVSAVQGCFAIVYQARRDGYGRSNGILNFVVEVTEPLPARQRVQQLNQELHLSNTKLTRTNADLDNFIYTASHDLKSPILNIEGLRCFPVK